MSRMCNLEMFLLKIESADGTARFGKIYPILDLQNFRVEKKIGDRQNYRSEFASALFFERRNAF